MLEAPPKIRGHHILCLQGFQGYGYDDVFVQAINTLLTDCSDPKQPRIVEVTDDCDTICNHCPHQHNRRCQKNPEANSRIKKIDRITLQKLGIRSHQWITFQELITLSHNILKTKSDIQDICGHCEWQDKCQWFTSRI